MLPVDDALAPKYWKHETGGALAVAMIAFIGRSPALDKAEVALVRAYFAQWVFSPVWAADSYRNLNPDLSAVGVSHGYLLSVLRQSITGANTEAQLRRWLAAAELIGIDPL